MNAASSLLLLFALFLGESFAGYSTGFRRTPKPKTPDVAARPVIYPNDDHNKEYQHWKGPPRGSVEIGIADEEQSKKIEEIHKNDKIDDGGFDKEIDQEKKIPEEDIKVGSHIGSSHLVPPTEEKKVPHDLPEIAGKDDIPVKLDDKSVSDDDVGIQLEDKVPSIPSKESFEGKEPSHIQDKDDEEDDDVSVKETHPRPDIPKSIGDEHVSHDVSDDTLSDSYLDQSLKEDTFVGDVTGGNVDDVSVKVTHPRPDIPKPIGDEHVSHDVSDDTLPDSYLEESLKEDTFIGDVTGGNVNDDLKQQVPDEKIHVEIKPDDDGAVGPLPHPDDSPKDIAVIPPRTEILEPYPIKVGAGNENINLYELMNRLELSRFLHLVEEANLQDLLTGEGPLTIFAPSDFALSKLDADTIRKLATNQELLRQFVLYHCVDGQIYGPSFEERDNSIMTTRFNQGIHINKYGEGWFANGIPITVRDQTCSNGVIHVLDSCLYPFPTGDLLETLEGLDNFKIYTELIRNAKLDNELKGEAFYTIFVPTDVAFSKLPPANLEWLKWDIPAIKRMFRQLTVRGTYYTSWIPSGNGQLSSIDEQTTLTLSGYPDSINVNGVGLNQYDITASNGCIHTIDDIWFLSELGTPSSSSQKKSDR